MIDTGDPSRYAGLDLLASSVLLVGPEVEVRYANPAAENLLELSLKSLQRAPLTELFTNGHELAALCAQALAHQYADLRQDLVLQRNGREPLHVNSIVSALKEGEGGELLIELRENVQQLKLDREERILDQSQANKELIRNLAHEIKNPLGGIRGAAQLLELELPEPALADYTRVIIREADRLRTLVDRLLEPHRHPQHMADVNIHEVCEHVRDLVLAEHPRGLEVVRDYDASIPELRGDRDQLVQVVLNIVRNAAQALQARIAAGDARIELRTRVARQLTLGRQRHRLALLLDVVDNGPGVPPHLQERIFVPLVTGRAEGTGLGLTLAQAFVQRHGGIIECESRPGCTRFGVVLPLATSS